MNFKTSERHCEARSNLIVSFRIFILLNTAIHLISVLRAFQLRLVDALNTCNQLDSWWLFVVRFPSFMLHYWVFIFHCPIFISHYPKMTFHCPISISHYPNSISHCPKMTFHCPISISHYPISISHCPISGNIRLSDNFLRTMSNLLCTINRR